MYPVSPGWRWRPISRTRRGVAHLCTFPPSGEVLLPNCPPPGGGLDIRWWKSCLFECALPGGTVRRPFHRGGVCPCAAIYRGEVPAGAGHIPEAYTRLALAIYRKPMTGWGWPFTGSRYPPRGGMRRPLLPGRRASLTGGYTRRPSTGKCIPAGGCLRRPFTGKWIPTGGCMRWPLDGIMEGMETKHM